MLLVVFRKVQTLNVQVLSSNIYARKGKGEDGVTLRPLMDGVVGGGLCERIRRLRFKRGGLAQMGGHST